MSEETKHTSETWNADKHSDGSISIQPDQGFTICVMADKAGQPSEANAQRIVACVNACEGIENPAELKSQRDDLLEVLEGLWEGIDLKRYDIRKGKDFSFLVQHAAAKTLINKVCR